MQIIHHEGLKATVFRTGTTTKHNHNIFCDHLDTEDKSPNSADASH